MRRLGWFVAGFGVAIAAAARLFRRPSAPPAPPPVEAPDEPADERADELRQRIAESRDLAEEREHFEEAETPVDEADPDERRRAVHDRARQAAERMRGDNE